MIAEVAITACLGIAGFGLLVSLAPGLPATARLLISFPTGAAVYMAVSSLWVVMTNDVDPCPVLAVRSIKGVVGLI